MSLTIHKITMFFFFIFFFIEKQFFFIFFFIFFLKKKKKKKITMLSSCKVQSVSVLQLTQADTNRFGIKLRMTIGVKCDTTVARLRG